MKGRYKLRTRKWEIKAAIEAEARELVRNRSEKQTRFLDAAIERMSFLDKPVDSLGGKTVDENGS